MKIPSDALIPEAKLTRYLLVPRPRSGKSKFLAQAGFTLENSDILLTAIRELASAVEAVEDTTSQYGTTYLVEGEITGPNGVRLSVVIVWLQSSIDGTFRFITLKPRKREAE